MKQYVFSLILGIVFFTGTMSIVHAATAHVLILDKERHIICDRDFEGDKGMDSIINTADVCGFTYTLAYGGDFLESINGIKWDGTNWWVLYVDGKYATKGVNEYDLDAISNIEWAFNAGSHTPPRPRSDDTALRVASAGTIVGLISPRTGGLIDSDGDEISDVDEIHAGTDPFVPEPEYVKEKKQLAAAAVVADTLKSIVRHLQGLLWLIKND